MKNTMTLAEINEALAFLNDLCSKEYPGVTLEDVLLDPNANISELRLQRLTGIALKKPFAKPGERTQSSVTRAERSWEWSTTEPDEASFPKSKELEIINELRMPGSWNDRKPFASTKDDQTPTEWKDFTHDVDHERGLFKVLVLYIDDKLKGKQKRSLVDYTEADESRRLEAGLDMATLVFDAAVTTPLVSLLGIHPVVVGTVLIGCRFGYRKLLDPTIRLGDSDS